MLAFEVYLNGEKLCLAGIANDGAMTAVVSLVNDSHCDLHVGASVGPEGDFAKWVDRDLNVGDEVAVKVVFADHVDEPKAVKKART